MLTPHSQTTQIETIQTELFNKANDLPKSIHRAHNCFKIPVLKEIKSI